MPDVTWFQWLCVGLGTYLGWSFGLAVIDLVRAHRDKARAEADAIRDAAHVKEILEELQAQQQQSVGGFVFGGQG